MLSTNTYGKRRVIQRTLVNPSDTLLTQLTNEEGWSIAFEQFVAMNMPGYPIPQAVYCCRLERVDSGKATSLLAEEEPDPEPDDTQPVVVMVEPNAPVPVVIAVDDPDEDATEEVPTVPAGDDPAAIVPAVRKVEGTIYTPLDDMTFEEGLAAGLTGQELLDLSFARLRLASERALASSNRLIDSVLQMKSDWDHKIATRHERVRTPEMIELSRKNRAEQRARWEAERRGERYE